MAQMSSRGYQTWVKAREANDFALFAPILTEWIALKVLISFSPLCPR